MKLNKEFFIKALKRLPDYYINFDLTESQAQAWYTFFQEYTEQELTETIKSFIKESAYAPTSPRHLQSYFAPNNTDFKNADLAFNEFYTLMKSIGFSFEKRKVMDLDGQIIEIDDFTSKVWNKLPIKTQYTVKSIGFERFKTLSDTNREFILRDFKNVYNTLKNVNDDTLKIEMSEKEQLSTSQAKMLTNEVFDRVKNKEKEKEE